ncbi:MAG: DUF6655 family protein [Isosphaeraceae bacterium]
MAKLALFAYDRSSGQLVWNSGTLVAVATAKDVHVLGVGPIQSGTIRGGTDFVGIRLPIPSDPNPLDPVTPGTRTPATPKGIEFRHSATYTDAESFAP